MDLTKDEEVPVPIDDFVNRMDNMMSMLMDLTQKVNSYDNQQADRAASPVRFPLMSKDDRRKTRCPASPTR